MAYCFVTGTIQRPLIQTPRRSSPRVCLVYDAERRRRRWSRIYCLALIDSFRCIEIKIFIRAVYYWWKSIARRTSLEIREFTLPGPGPFWQKRRTGVGFKSAAYGEWDERIDLQWSHFSVSRELERVPDEPIGHKLPRCPTKAVVALRWKSRSERWPVYTNQITTIHIFSWVHGTITALVYINR